MSYAAHDLSYMCKKTAVVFIFFPALLSRPRRVFFRIPRTSPSIFFYAFFPLRTLAPAIAALSFRFRFQDIPDKSLQAYALRLPDPATLAEEMDVIDPDALYKALK